MLAYIGLGCNIGSLSDMLERMRNAVRAMENAGVDVVARSAVYRSPAWGVLDQDPFINAAIAGAWNASPSELLVELKLIEEALGREPTYRWGPRIIDLDILLIEGVEVDEPGLQVPHEHLLDREFAWVPLLEIAPDAELPRGGRVDDLVERTAESNLEVVGEL